MMAGGCASLGGRRSLLLLLLLLLLPVCCADCGGATRLEGDGSVETDAAADTEVRDGAGDGDVPVDVDSGGDADAEADAARVCCNGIVELGEECDSDPPRACMTSCGSTGSQACVGCRWEAMCCAAFEVCGNGCDDDCDTSTDEAACGIGTACTGDAACTGAGVVCNGNWGICVVSSCTGQPDFTPCELITEPSDRAYDICVDEACVSPGCGDATCNPPGPNWTLPDTSQRLCCCLGYHCPATRDHCPGTAGTDGCATAPYCGQDPQYGWDVTHAASERFTRTEGEEPIVTDNVTGLVWQGCLAGQTGPTCDGFDSGYTWEGALSYCDSLSWGGFADWGLPDRYQLESIVDYDMEHWPESRMRIDLDAFPATTGDVYHWSSSSCAESASDAWYVDFRWAAPSPREMRIDRSVEFADKTASWRCVRCVRLTVMRVRAGGSRFTRTAAVADQPVVADAATGRVWQGCPAGQTGLDCSGSGSRYEWEEAMAYCEGLDWGGYTDWYLPNVRELASIVDDRRARPSIDTTAFPGVVWYSWSWSSSVAASYFDPWTLDFRDGHLVSSVPYSRSFVRCVRCGP